MKKSIKSTDIRLRIKSIRLANLFPNDQHSNLNHQKDAKLDERTSLVAKGAGDFLIL